MRRFVEYLRQEWLVIGEIVLLGLFAAGDASGAFETLFGLNIPQGWVVVAAILIIGVTALLRIGKLRAELAEQQSRVRITARIGSFAANHPDLGPDKASLRVHVFWEMWVNEDVSIDRVGLNLIHLYGRHWWALWKQTRFPQVGMPPNGQETTHYRKRIFANEQQPHREDAVFEYLEHIGDDRSMEPHWLLELVIMTGMPVGEHRIPVALDYGELRSRGANPPL